MADKKNQSRDTSDTRPERSDAAYWRKLWGMEDPRFRFPEPYPDGERNESVVIIRGFRNPFVKGDSGGSGDSNG